MTTAGGETAGPPATERDVPAPPSRTAALRRSLGTGRARLARVTGAAGVLEAEAARALTRREVIALAILVVVPALISAIALLPELTVPTPSVSDDSVHFLFIQRASEALAGGQNVFDHWDSQFEAGVPQFLYYQHLPALAVIGIQRLSLGALDLLTAFNLTRYVLMVAFPLTVFVSMRTFGFSAVAGAMAAAASTLLSGDFRYGFEYDSYTFRGFGLFTQLWAMHVGFMALAAAYAAIQHGRRIWLAALLFGLLVLTHVIYAYMVAMAIGVMALWGLRRTNLRARLLRLAAVGGFSAAISGYMWLPFLAQTAYLNATPYLQREKYDSFGAGPILSWLVSGDLLDHGRLPVLTILLSAGIVAALISRTRVALVALALFLTWLAVYFGRPTLGPLVDLLPLHGSLLLHRFLGGVDFAAILLIGVGGAVIWQLWRPHTAAWRLAGATLAIGLLLAPAIGERVSFHAFNTVLKERTSAAVASDFDAGTIFVKLETLPAGRVFAGLPATYGKDMAIGDVYFYNLLAFNAAEALPPPNESFSLNADYIWDFDDGDAADFDLWNVRYLVAPAGREVASFLSPIIETARYTLYQAPTTGYAEFVEIVARRAMPTQGALFASNLEWERGTLPATRQYIRYDYPATVAGTGGGSVAGCPGGGLTAFELFEPGQINLVVECSAASTLVIKTTYHPNWRLSVDGSPVPAFMVSPSYIGISMPAGRHTVDAVYEATPIKAPLQVIGLAAILVLVLARKRLDLAAPRVAARPADLGPVPPPAPQWPNP